jgi:hypothetical protein
MLRKGNEVKWTPEARIYFEQIKQALVDAPVLISPDYSKDFFIFSFSSNDTLVVVLLQKNSDGMEQPISFFSRALRDVEVKYDIMEKQAYALVKALKSFRVYVLHSKIIDYVPSSSVKEILIHPDIDGKRSKWIAKILEFDLEVKPTKLVKGQGLARLLVESNCKELGVNFMSTNSINQQSDIPSSSFQISSKLAECSWYKDLIYFLQNLHSLPLDLRRPK